MSGRRAPRRSPADDRMDEISDFYGAHAHRLRALVARKTGAPTEAVADACQTAWATLLRRPDIGRDARGLGWLTVVAVHEVHHQWRDRARNLPMGALSLGMGDPGELDEPTARGDGGVEELVAARLEYAERVADFAALKPAERTALYLQALGYRYREIASATDASYTAVNRRLTEGRARLRRIALGRANQRPK
jgi:DNA-directed RNA polymerase specialized sigma24 family protein